MKSRAAAGSCDPARIWNIRGRRLEFQSSDLRSPRGRKPSFWRHARIIFASSSGFISKLAQCPAAWYFCLYSARRLSHISSRAAGLAKAGPVAAVAAAGTAVAAVAVVATVAARAVGTTMATVVALIVAMALRFSAFDRDFHHARYRLRHSC